MSDGEIPYAEESRAEWNDAMAAASTVRIEPDEADPAVILITAVCPRCEHQTALDEQIAKHRSIEGVRDDPRLREALRRSAAENRSRDVRVPCRCRVAHPGTPDEKSGCGASWSLHVEWGV